MLKLENKSLTFILISGLVMWLGAAAAQGASEPWREAALVAVDHFATSIEVLDEALHEAHEHQSTPEFQKAIEDFHHIEDVLTHLKTALPAEPMETLCHDFAHLLEDLLQIRLDLIALGLQSNAKVVQTWNNMANIFNTELAPFFRTCPPQWSGVVSTAIHTL